MLEACHFTNSNMTLNTIDTKYVLDAIRKLKKGNHQVQTRLP